MGPVTWLDISGQHICNGIDGDGDGMRKAETLHLAEACGGLDTHRNRLSWSCNLKAEDRAPFRIHRGRAGSGGMALRNEGKARTA